MLIYDGLYTVFLIFPVNLNLPFMGDKLHFSYQKISVPNIETKSEGVIYVTISKLTEHGSFPHDHIYRAMNLFFFFYFELLLVYLLKYKYFISFQVTNFLLF